MASSKRTLPARLKGKQFSSLLASKSSTYSRRNLLENSRKKVAIIIPCRNEEAYIGRCLDSLLIRYPFIRIVDNPEQNKSAALNLGIRSTTSEIVMRIDAHATYAKDYIARLVDGLERHQVENIGGIRETYSEGGPWKKAIGIVISHRFAVGNAYYRTGVETSEPRQVDTVFCGCYRREVFENIGLFHPSLIRTQDRELNARLTASGGKILLDPTVRCMYFPRTGLFAYTRWNFSGAFWVYYAGRFTTTRMRSMRNFVPALFVTWHLFTILASFCSPVMLAPMLIPIAAYWALAAFFAIEAAVRERSLLLFPSLLLLFATTHYVYGVASWLGLTMRLMRGTEHVDIPAYRNAMVDGGMLEQAADSRGVHPHAA